jgi:hypothetical protein
MASRAARDMGLERIARSTRWLAVGLLAGGGALSAAVAKTFPGHSASSSHSVSTPSSTSPSSTSVPPTSTGAQETPDTTTQQAPDTTPLTAPAQVPQPVSSQPVVSSGGS